ncbi:MAG: glycosyltransferase [Candidatus Marsarchaeota archaeon]|nr:glycosyltransferase [Candidatus Marsarchaeota archaeon]
MITTVAVILYVYVTFMFLCALFFTAASLVRFRQEPFKIGKSDQKVIVMVPCKGIDYTFENNLKSIKSQDYKNYNVVAIVDDIGDPAVGVARKLGIKVLVTGKRFNLGSGKVNALSTAISKLSGYDIYVIADSDILVNKDWLRKLVEPLVDKSIGLSTAFPYFKPKGGFWSKVKLVWGFVGQGMMESKVLRFGWGGSLAFRKELIDKKAFETFRRSLSDDIAITRMVREKGLRIYYVPEAQPIVNSPDDFKTFAEWANRQTALSIMGNDRILPFGIAFYSLSFILFVSAILLGLLYSYLLFILLVPYMLGILKNHSRLKEKCPEFFLIQTLIPILFVANLVAAKSMKNIRWRGRQYKLKQVSPVQS